MSLKYFDLIDLGMEGLGPLKLFIIFDTPYFQLLTKQWILYYIYFTVTYGFLWSVIFSMDTMFSLYFQYLTT